MGEKGWELSCVIGGLRDLGEGVLDIAGFAMLREKTAINRAEGWILLFRSRVSAEAKEGF